MTIRELALAGQLGWSKNVINSDGGLPSELREAGNIELLAPFPVRYALIFWANSNEISGFLYEQTCDREDPSDVLPHGRSLGFKLEKDLRRKDSFWTRGSGPPIDPNTYGKWTFKPGNVS